MSSSLVEQAAAVLECAPCQVVLPAGCGKTELLASAAAISVTAGTRVLVLTHTHAGVAAVRERLGRSARPLATVTTIDAWCRALIEGFPITSGYAGALDPPDWPSIHRAVSVLLKTQHLQEVLGLSYGRVLVDEYQDCTVAQHQVVCAIAQVLPVSILGDPLQAVYDFGGNVLVDWQSDLGQFTPLELSAYPWRWHQTNPDLGLYLLEVRRALLAGDSIDLQAGRSVGWLQDTRDNRVKSLYGSLQRPGPTLALARWEAQCVSIASIMKGNFGVLEDVAGTLFNCHEAAIDASSGVQTATSLLAFASECMTGLAPSSDVGRIFASCGSDFPKYGGQKCAEVVDALRNACEEPSGANLIRALASLEAVGGHVHRREAWREMKRAALQRDTGALSLLEGVNASRERIRNSGRFREARTIARVPLIKGEQYAECIVLEAHSYRRNELYVALTRGMDRVTVLSSNPVLAPQA